MSDETRGRGPSLTIKYSGAKDATWINFCGTVEDIREDVAAWFGIESATLAGMTPHEVSLTGESIAHGTGVVRTVLGGTPIGQAEKPKVDGDDPWSVVNDGGSPGPVPEPAISPLFGQIEKCGSVDELKALWAENQSAFDDADLMTAWKARGKELSK